MPLSNLVIWRVFALLGALFSALATEVAAFPSSNATYSSGVTAVNSANSFRNSGQVLTIPLKRVNHKGVTTPSIAKRFFKTEVFGVYGAAYLAELTIGTSTEGNQQVIDVLIDTGSFELWVNPNCSASNVPDFCKAFGHYDPTLSSTSQKVNNNGFSIKYGSGHAMGPYYKDDIYISGVKIQDQQFGVANSSELVWFGIMGLARSQGIINYPLVIDSIAAQGFTNTKLFSMNLGRQVNPGAVITGEMAFGGVDTNSYAGMLKKVPTDPSDPHYKIVLQSLGYRAPGAGSSTPLVDSSLPLPLIVDSGTTLSLLPEPLVSKLAAQFPGAKSDGAGGYRVSCAYQNQTGTVDFEFLGATGTVTINIAYSDFIWNNGGDCFLGAWFSNDVGTFILGDSFLRGAYVAFDQTNNALFMANRLSCGDGESNLVAVPAGSDAAANIPGSCSAVGVSPSTSPYTLAPSPTSSTEIVSNTSIPTVTPTLGPSMNPVGPADTITITLSTPSSSPSSIPSSLETSSPSTFYQLSSMSSPTVSIVPSASSLPTTSDISSLPSMTTGFPSGSGGDPSVTQSVPTGVSADPNDSPKIHGANVSEGPMTTITDTITRTVVYTVTTCPETVKDCPLRGKVATRYETILTTYCPGRDEATFITGASAPLITPAIIKPDMPHISIINRPPIVDIGPPTYPVDTGATGSNAEQGQGQGQGQGHGHVQVQGQGQGMSKEAQISVITTVCPTTKTYAVTSCSPGDAACTVGMTTTAAVTTTVVKTLHVQPIPTPIPAGNGLTAAGSNTTAAWNSTGGRPAVVAASTAPNVVLSARRLAAVLALALIWGIMAAV